MRFIILTRKIARWTRSSVRGSNEPSKPIRIKKIHSHLINRFMNEIVVTNESEWVEHMYVMFACYVLFMLLCINSFSSRLDM
jgi:hypothetical protein